jgi:hypothetical protein
MRRKVRNVRENLRTKASSEMSPSEDYIRGKMNAQAGSAKGIERDGE